MNFSEKDINESWEQNKPLQIGMFFPRNICNANCVYCYTTKWKPRPESRKLSLGEMENILVESKKMGCRQVLFPGLGEPMMNDEFWPLMDKAKELNMPMSIYTNGTLIDEEVAKRLKEYDVSIMVKLDSLDEKKMDKILRKDGLGKKLREGIDYLIKEGFNEPDETTGQTRLAIHITACKATVEEAPEVVEWAIKNNIFPFVERLFPTGSAMNTENFEFLGSPNEVKWDYYPNIKKTLKELFPERDKAQDTFGEGYCKLETYSVLVNSYGEGMQCGSRWDENIGNIGLGDKLQDIWDKNEEERKKRIKGIKDGTASKCEGCRMCEEKNAGSCPAVEQILSDIK